MRRRTCVGCGWIVAVVVAFASLHDASAQGPGALNAPMGRNRGAGSGMVGGVAGSSVPMMMPQRATRQRPSQSSGAPARSSSQVTNFIGGNANILTQQARGGNLMRSSEAVTNQAKMASGGVLGVGAVRGR